jgi:O-antigen ligase
MIPVFFTVLTPHQAKNGLFIFISSLGIYALFSFLIYIDIIHIQSINMSNPSDMSNPRGILAYAIVTPYMVIAFLSSLVIIFNSKNNYIKILFSSIALLSLIGIFINNGRAGQLAFIITIVILTFINRKSIFNPKIIFLLILTILLSTIFLNTSGKFTKMTRSFSELQNLEEKQFAGSWGHRAYMWYAAGNILQENYIIGVGAGDNIDEFIQYTKSHPSKATWLRTFHNQHLDTLTKYGIIGFVLLWSSVIILLIQLYSSNFYFQIGMIFFSVSFFDGIGDIILLMKPYNTIFMLVFLLLSIISYHNTDRNKLA